MQLNNLGNLTDVRGMLRKLMAKGFTEQAIAMAVRVNQSTISRILSGEIRNPRFDLVLKIQIIFQQYD